MIRRTIKCEICGYELPTWATRCISCEELKYREENASIDLQRQKGKISNFFENIKQESKPQFIEQSDSAEPFDEDVIDLETVPEYPELQEKVTISALYLGGTGAKIERGLKGTLVINDNGFFFQNNKSAWSVGMDGLISFQISGSGAFQTGGGWFGGGFGFSGAMQGAALASLMNMVTTRTHFDCILRILYPNLDLTFQILDRTPRQLEIDLTGLKYLVEKQPNQSDEAINLADGVDTLLKLSVLLEKGLISREEFDKQKNLYLRNS